MTLHRGTTPCPACKASRGKRLTHKDGKSGQPLDVLQCAGCGLGRIDPMPTADDLAHWYSSHYREEYKAATVPRLTHVLRAARIAAERWTWARAQAGFVLPQRSLDVGASSGEFVYLLQRLGVHGMGIEPHAGYARFARESLGLDVLNGSLSQSVGTLAPESFDLVSLFHVLEHLHDPVEALQALGRLLTPRGLLYIEVPDASRMGSPRNTFFRAHTLYFTAHTLRSVAQAAGFTVVANNFDDEDNLRVLLRRAPADEPTVGWMPSDALYRAALARTWPRYLAYRLAQGGNLVRLRRRWEEKRTARQFGNARELLDATYAALPDAVPAARERAVVVMGGQ